MRRPRGPGGRFLTSEEIAAQKNAESHADDPSTSNSQDGDGDEDDEQDAMHPDIDHDADMVVASPIERPLSHSIPESAPSEEPNSAQIPTRVATIQPLLHPRPHIQIQTIQPLQKAEDQVTQPMHPQPTPQHLSVQSPFDQHVRMPHAAGTLDLLSAPYMPSSHPATPTTISPQSAMSDVMPAPERVHNDHTGHAHHPHPHPRIHDHQRHGSASSTTLGSGQASPSTTTPSPSVASVRNPYAGGAMRMHHVPHPHAHTRHRHIFLNSQEHLYPNANNQSMCILYFRTLSRC